MPLGVGSLVTKFRVKYRNVTLHVVPDTLGPLMASAAINIPSSDNLVSEVEEHTDSWLHGPRQC